MEEWRDSPRTATAYPPSDNSLAACDPITLQTRDFEAREITFPGNWRDSWGDQAENVELRSRRTFRTAQHCE